MSNKTWIDEVEERASRATPNIRFESIKWADGSCSYEHNAKRSFIVIHERDYKEPMRAKFDAGFFSAARTDVPELCRRLKMAIEELERVSEGLSSGRYWTQADCKNDVDQLVRNLKVAPKEGE